jgi:glycosyltransferase involved in cell wall biosynthesis
MRVVLAADFPVHCLPGFEDRPVGHHATWLDPLSRELASKPDLDLHWITCTKEVRSYQEIQHLGQTFHLIPRGRLAVEMLTRFRSERHQIATLGQRLLPDLFHGWGTEQGYALAANDFGKSSLISLQGILTACCSASRMPFLARIQARAEKSALARATTLTVESSWGADQLKKLAPQARIHLLEYGVDPACFETQRNFPLPSLFPEFQHFPQQPRAIFVGSFNHLKGGDTLLKAFLDPRLARVSLDIYGVADPSLVPAQVPSHIRFHGHRPRHEVLQAMATAWCLVHPTRADTSPNAVKEARVIGLPVVTSSAGGQTQYVQHGESGFIHDPDDIDALIEGVLHLTASPEINQFMGSHDQEHCRQLLDPARTVENLIHIYRGMVDDG